MNMSNIQYPPPCEVLGGHQEMKLGVVLKLGVLTPLRGVENSLAVDSLRLDSRFLQCQCRPRI